jgi:hypothetical protein
MTAKQRRKRQMKRRKVQVKKKKNRSKLQTVNSSLVRQIFEVDIIQELHCRC